MDDLRLCIDYTDKERILISQYGELCHAVARAAIERNGLTFDLIERINEHEETHKRGTRADIAYRKAALNKAVAKVAANPLMYGI